MWACCKRRGSSDRRRPAACGPACWSAMDWPRWNCGSANSGPSGRAVTGTWTGSWQDSMEKTMKIDPRFEFVVDKARNRITVEREFSAKQQLVWDCHTRREYLDQWFAPKPLTTRTKHLEFKAGGYWHYAMVMPDGQSFWSRLDYQSVAPIDGYVALDGFSDESGAVNPE